MGSIPMLPHFSQLVTKPSVFYYFTNCNVSSYFNENDTIMITIKMFEIHENYIYDDIFHSKPYLGTM